MSTRNCGFPVHTWLLKPDFSKKFTLDSGYKKLRFQEPTAAVTCGWKAKQCRETHGFKNTRVCVDSLWDKGQMREFLLKGPILWCHEENHVAFSNFGWRWGHNTFICPRLCFKISWWVVIYTGYIIPFPWNHWSMPQLCSEPCHCSSHPAQRHLRSWVKAARLFSMSLRSDLLKYFIVFAAVIHAYIICSAQSFFCDKRHFHSNKKGSVVYYVNLIVLLELAVVRSLFTVSRQRIKYFL